MKKQIQDSPKFKFFEENYEKLVKEMEEDKDFAQIKMPDEWQKDFERIFDET